MRATAVRRLAVAAQGYAGRYRRATGASVEAAIRSLSCVQLDSISTVIPRAQLEGRLVVRAFHREDGVRASGALDDALDRALYRLARTIGLEEVRR